MEAQRNQRVAENKAELQKIDVLCRIEHGLAIPLPPPPPQFGPKPRPAEKPAVVPKIQPAREAKTEHLLEEYRPT